MLEAEHLLNWSEKIFGCQPLHKELSEEECWVELRAAADEIEDLIPEVMPVAQLDFFHRAMPRLLPNQRAISTLIYHLSKEKNTWVYAAWNTGFGKTTAMPEIGYDLALNVLPKTGNSTVTVQLVVMTLELVGLHEKSFAEKLKEANKRIKFVWVEAENFRTQWLQNEKAYSKDIVVADEGDLMLTRAISDQKPANWPKRFVLLSAVPRSSWTPTQEHAFSNNGRKGIYFDATCVFPRPLL